MDDAELLAGVLYNASDPRVAAQQLTTLLLTRPDPSEARRAGFDPELVDVVRSRLGGDRDRIVQACALGAAWVMGRRSDVAHEPWELVASLPPGIALPTGLRRTTGETLMGLVVQATRSLRLVSPFIDRPGLAFLGDALAAATLRRVQLEVFFPPRSTHAEEAIGELRSTIQQRGAVVRLRIAALQTDAPWAHLKVLTADSIMAYIGSANITRAGIAGRNLELGVLVRGPDVAVVDALIDQFRDR